MHNAYPEINFNKAKETASRIIYEHPILIQPNDNDTNLAMCFISLYDKFISYMIS